MQWSTELIVRMEIQVIYSDTYRFSNESAIAGDFVVSNTFSHPKGKKYDPVTN